MRTGNKRFERRKVYFYNSVVFSVGVGCKRLPILASSLRFKERFRNFVGREYRRCCAEFRAHIRYRCSFGNGQRFYSLAAPFDNGAHAAFN